PAVPRGGRAAPPGALRGFRVHTAGSDVSRLPRDRERHPGCARDRRLRGDAAAAGRRGLVAGDRAARARAGASGGPALSRPCDRGGILLGGNGTAALHALPANGIDRMIAPTRLPLPIRARISGADAAVWGVAAALTFAVTLLAAHSGPKVPLSVLLGVLVFLAVLVGFVKAPHVVIACAIPYFCLLPMMKVLVTAQLGPTKDVIEIAAFLAAAVLMLRRRFLREPWEGDTQVLVLTLLLLALYVFNIGTAIRGGNVVSLEWFHGVRLVGEPLLLMLVGMTVADPRKTFHWALKSLILTVCGAALIGLFQQVIGPARLITLGYSYKNQVRTIGGHLRSFGPFDEPFDYAAMVAFGLAGVLLWAKKRTVVWMLGPVIAAGLAVSFVRGAALSVVALIALLLARKGYASVATVVLGAAAATAVAFVFLASQPTPGKVVQAGPSTYLTLNGRDRSWRVALGNPSYWPFGRGVGVFGTAATRVAAESQTPTLDPR